MGEDRKLLTVFTVCVGISLISLLLSQYDIRNLVKPLTANYRAEIILEERIYLKEAIVFEVKKEKKFKMLYRLWKVPLVYKTTLSKPYLQVIDFSGDGTAYLKDYKGNVFLKESNSELGELALRKALRNEVGIIKQEGFEKGEFTVLSEYWIFPPLNYDENYTHVNLKLADEHIPYNRVEIVISDPRNLIKKVYPHIPLFSLERNETLWILEGKAPENKLVEIELLLKNDNLEGFTSYIPRVKDRVESANATLSTLYTLLNIIRYLLILFVLSMPFVLLLIYRKYGAEKKYTVPQFLSYIPNKERKPWLVNMLYYGDSTVTDQNAFFATLLDMEKRGFLELDTIGGDIKVRIKGKVPQDPYERKVLTFLITYAEGNTFSLEKIENRISELERLKDTESLKRIKADFDSIFSFSDKTLVEKFLTTKGHTLIRIVGLLCIFIFGAFLIGILVISKKYPLYIYDLILLSTASIVLTNIPHLLLPSQIFGRWKGDFYKEKLEWEAFRNFLSDMVMMKKYSPEDIVIWEEWLIYATTLGVAEKVEKAMENLKINIPIKEKSYFARRRFYRTYYHISKVLTASKPKVSGPKGKSFGVGGGFGGGGAGGR